MDKKDEKVWTKLFNTMVECQERTWSFSWRRGTTKPAKLNNWISTRRLASGASQRKERLADVGFDLNQKNNAQEDTVSEQQAQSGTEMYSKLCDFKQHYGHCRVLHRRRSVGRWQGGWHYSALTVLRHG
jgi:hypothetical protein